MFFIKKINFVFNFNSRNNFLVNSRKYCYNKIRDFKLKLYNLLNFDNTITIICFYETELVVIDIIEI